MFAQRLLERAMRLAERLRSSGYPLVSRSLITSEGLDHVATSCNERFSHAHRPPRSHYSDSYTSTYAGAQRDPVCAARGSSATHRERFPESVHALWTEHQSRPQLDRVHNIAESGKIVNNWSGLTFTYRCLTNRFDTVNYHALTPSMLVQVRDDARPAMHLPVLKSGLSCQIHFAK
jgi:hypothetical protein